MTCGSPWSEAFVRDMSDKEFRDEYVADQVRTRIALLIRALREQADREWSQARLGQEMGKPQSVVSRIENPDYGKLSLQTLFEVAAAFDLPLWIDIPEWEDWLRLIRDVPSSKTSRRSFNADSILSSASADSQTSCEIINVISLDAHRRRDDTGCGISEFMREEIDVRPSSGTQHGGYIMEAL